MPLLQNPDPVEEDKAVTETKESVVLLLLMLWKVKER